MEFEFHSPPEASFEIDVGRLMAAAKDAGAESIMLYTQDHWGYAFYPTKVGVQHPSLRYDLVGRLVESAHLHGLSTIAYYSVHFNNQAVFAHPDWAMRDKDGKEWQMPDRWFVACLDSPYRNQVLGMLREIFTAYPFDALFMDIFGINLVLYYIGIAKDPLCYCAHTQAAWEKTEGEPFLKGLGTPEGWRARYEWTKKVMLMEPLGQVLKLVREVRPNLVVTLNGGPLWIPTEVLDKLSYIFAEPIFSPGGISLSSIILRGWRKPGYQSGVWGRAGYQDKFPGRILRAEANASLIQNARVFHIGGAPVIGTLPEGGYSHQAMNNAKETFADVRAVEQHLGRLEPVLSIGVIVSESTKEHLAVEKKPLQFRHSVLGALELMTFTHYPVEAVPDRRLHREALTEFDAIVLPETEAMSDAAAEALREYVHEGGTLIASGKCGIVNENGKLRSNFALSQVFGVDFAEEVTKYAAGLRGGVYDRAAIYLQPEKHPLALGLGAQTVGVPGPFVRLDGEAQAVFRYLLPALVEDVSRRRWWNWDSPPPGQTTAGPAVTYHRYGKGQAVYIGVSVFQVFQSQWHWMREWVPYLVRQLVPRPMLRFRKEVLPFHGHGTFFWQKRRRRILAQFVNTTEMVLNGTLAPPGGVTIVGNTGRIRLTGAEMLYPHR